MGEQLNDLGSDRDVWNKGKLLGQKRPLQLKEIWGIRIRLELTGKTRDLAIVELDDALAIAEQTDV